MSVTAPEQSGVAVLSNYIDGRWVPSKSSELLDVVNPANNEVMAQVPLSTAGELEVAVAAARAALPGWRSESTIPAARSFFKWCERVGWLMSKSGTSSQTQTIHNRHIPRLLHLSFLHFSPVTYTNAEIRPPMNG